MFSAGLSLVGCCFPCSWLLVAVLLCWLMIKGFCVLCLLRCCGVSAKPKQGWVLSNISLLDPGARSETDTCSAVLQIQTHKRPAKCGCGKHLDPCKLHANINFDPVPSDHFTFSSHLPPKLFFFPIFELNLSIKSTFLLETTPALPKPAGLRQKWLHVKCLNPSQSRLIHRNQTGCWFECRLRSSSHLCIH